MNYDIITFGSATRDVFLKSKYFKIVGEKKFVTGLGLCLSLGSKIDVEDIYFSTGGGGTNVAATFVNQGFKTAFCGMVGKDFAAEQIISSLEKLGIDTSFLLRTDKKPTNYSVILSSNGKERTILVFRGAAGELSKKNIPWSKLKTQWLYLAPLSGKLAHLFGTLVDFAHKEGIMVAANPGNSQLALDKKELKKILKKIDVLILNLEEAALLTGLPFKKEKEIFKKLKDMVPGIWVVTKGPGGAVASDGLFLYSAPILNLKTKVVDRTGAGDAFASGFLSGLIKKTNIVSAMQMGIANSAACLRKCGAKEGILEKNQRFGRVKVKQMRL